VQALNEKKRESLHISFAAAEADRTAHCDGDGDGDADDDGNGDGDAVSCVLEMQERTKGLFRR
jgi:hypothetical protein